MWLVLNTIGVNPPHIMCWAPIQRLKMVYRVIRAIIKHHKTRMIPL